jgi:arylsulfatase A-like enzyme
MIEMESESSSSEREDKPNIIFILADDLGYGDVGCFGQKKIRTPNLDRMAEEGIKLTSFYAGSTVCAPSRSCLMQGLHTGHATVRDNHHFFPEGNWPINDEDVTVAEVLKEAGYINGVVGKWGLGGPLHPLATPNNQGFDHWFGFLCQTLAHHYYPDYLWKNGDRWFNSKVEYANDLFTDEALNFINKNHDRPFFLYVAYIIPHAELLVPERSIREYRGKFPEEPFEGRKIANEYIYGTGNYAPQTTPKAAFAGMVTRMDRDIGKIINLLKELEIDENTLVIFSSDNGPHEEGGADPEFFNSNGPLRGIKRDFYEGGIRVPTIAWWPGKIQANTESDQPFAFWDFMPTAAELAGIEPPEDIDGISMLPTLLGKDQKGHEYLYWEFRSRGGKQAVRMGKWKGVRLNLEENPDAPIEIYNLEEDIGEKNNVASQYPEVVKKIRRIMEEARTESERFPLFR